VTILAVCGLKREAALLEKASVRIAVGGSIEITPDISGIISIGIAGALAPELAAGDIVVAERVVTACKAFETDAKWTARLAASFPGATIGAILGRGTIADTAEVKALLHESTGAIAVDMESHLAAEAAHAHGLPFAALRTISDRADQALPPAALVAMNPDGSIALGRVLWSVARSPVQIPALIRTGRESDKAFAALLGCVEALGPGLRGPDLGLL
jgi:hopanoid-associated phosphorylase